MSDQTPSNPLPENLDHKPIYGLPYENFDWRFAPGTDVRWISVGQAQFDSEDLSLKIFRHSGNRWSRMSEEIPVSRVPDAALFLAKSLWGARSDGKVYFPSGTFEGQTEDLLISPKRSASTVLARYQNGDQSETLKKRFRELRDVLNSLTDEGEL